MMIAKGKRTSRFSVKRESVKPLGKEGLEHLPYADRLDTPLETAVDSKWAEAKTFVERLSPDERHSFLFEAEMTGFAFCGHVMADLDSIAGAIGAAVSFSFGICFHKIGAYIGSMKL